MTLSQLIGFVRSVGTRERDQRCFDINDGGVCLDKSCAPVLLPGLDRADLFVVAVHGMVVEANDGGLS